MKTSSFFQNLIVMVLLCISSIATAHEEPSSKNKKAWSSGMEVSFTGVNGEYLLFTVRASVNARSFFIIRNEKGEDLYRETCNEGDNIRNLRIQRGDLKTLHFILSHKKDQRVRTFKVNTQYVETIEVKESGR